jgi:O-antigen/teichoic acid export membrane protein
MEASTENDPAQNTFAQEPTIRMPPYYGIKDRSSDTIYPQDADPYAAAYYRPYVPEYRNKLPKSGNAFSIILIVLAGVALLLATLHFVPFIITLMDIDSLDHPITSLLALIYPVILWAGVLLSLIAAVNNSKKNRAMTQAVIAAALVAAAVLSLPVINAVT